MNKRLTEIQLKRLASALHEGAVEASGALATWIQSDSLVQIDSVEQLPLREGIGLVGHSGEVCCFTTLQVEGWLQGHLILGFDDASGLSLTDLILANPVGTARDWGDVEKSSALETMNIIGSVYLNALARHYSAELQNEIELLPTPPSFFREFADCLLQSAFIDQASLSDWIVVAKTSFTIRGERLNWTLLFVPCGDSMQKLSSLSNETDPEKS